MVAGTAGGGTAGGAAGGGVPYFDAGTYTGSGGQFTWLKFIHPVRTARWRSVNLPICLIWVVLAGWSVAEHFNPPHLVKLALGVTSVWLIVVGMVMQAFPAKRAARSAP